MTIHFERWNPGGAVNASFAGQPRSSRAYTLPKGTANRSHNSAIHPVIPRTVYMRLLRLFLACWTRVAQTQLLGEYPLELSSRSTDMPSGGGPISFRKFSNFIHRLQTVMPRPPYLGYQWLFGFRQRVLIPLHLLYAMLRCPFLEWPWVNRCFFTTSSARQPHERVWPTTNCKFRTTTMDPQSQIHREHVLNLLPVRSGAASSSTSSLQNRRPTRLSRNSVGRSRLQHPHDEVCPLNKSPWLITTCFPHSQRHTHLRTRSPDGFLAHLVSEIIVNLPKVWPWRNIRSGITSWFVVLAAGVQRQLALAASF